MRKPYPGIQCDKRFSRACDLQTRMRTHTEEKLNVCIQCGKRFIETSQLMKHMRKGHIHVLNGTRGLAA